MHRGFMAQREHLGHQAVAARCARAPKDGKLPHGLYSFSENFHGGNGDAARDCEFGAA